jgi:hypothetical protein
MNSSKGCCCKPPPHLACSLVTLPLSRFQGDEMKVTQKVGEVGYEESVPEHILEKQGAPNSNLLLNYCWWVCREHAPHPKWVPKEKSHQRAPIV